MADGVIELNDANFDTEFFQRFEPEIVTSLRGQLT